MKRAVFDDWFSWLHFLAGFICAFVPFLFVLTLAFLFYQLWEKEEDINKVGDFVEFLTGFATGLQVLILVIMRMLGLL